MVKNIWQKLKKPIIGLAPMDGVTDVSFRLMAMKYGKPDLMITEFVSVEGICHGAVKTLRSLILGPGENSTLAQLFGSTPEAFYKASFVAAELGFAGIDINMGCPARNIAAKGAGASLIKKPELAKEIISACRSACNDWSKGKKIEKTGLPESIIEYVRLHRKKMIRRKTIPVSVKTRTGYTENTVYDWINRLLEAKPDAISLHGRTFKQLYGGQADWEAIALAAKLAHAKKTVILGNGDVTSLAEARTKAKIYGVDGVLIGRAALGNPWIFRDIVPAPAARLKAAVWHSRLFEAICGKKHFVPIRKHLGWYCKGFPHAVETRLKLMNSNNADEVEQIVKEVLKKL